MAPEEGHGSRGGAWGMAPEGVHGSRGGGMAPEGVHGSRGGAWLQRGGMGHGSRGGAWLQRGGMAPEGGHGSRGGAWLQRGGMAPEGVHGSRGGVASTWSYNFRPLAVVHLMHVFCTILVFKMPDLFIAQLRHGTVVRSVGIISPTISPKEQSVLPVSSLGTMRKPK